MNKKEDAMTIFNISGSFDLGSLSELTKMEVEKHLFKYGEKEPDTVEVMFSKERDRFSCRIFMITMKKEFIAEEVDLDVKVALGKAIENMEKQLRRYHDRLIGSR
jgi:ribosome-associated translation inhibitor RaiA